jgi:protein-S-isoprenylcysteine O-methyltransferase Ste14
MAGVVILVCWALLVLYWNLSARSVKSASEAQGFDSRLARIPVWLGFALFGAAWIHPFGPAAIRRTALSNSIGVAICVLGLFVAIWSRRTLGAEWSQVERGPYRFMRHPIYTGHLLMGLGTAVASGSLIAFVGLASFVVGFWIKLNQEERLLLRGLPNEYPAYKKRVRALIPYVL